MIDVAAASATGLDAMSGAPENDPAEMNRSGMPRRVARRTEAALRQPGDRPSAPVRDRAQVGVDPRDQLVDVEGLPVGRAQRRLLVDPVGEPAAAVAVIAGVGHHHDHRVLPRRGRGVALRQPVVGTAARAVEQVEHWDSAACSSRSRAAGARSPEPGGRAACVETVSRQIRVVGCLRGDHGDAVPVAKRRRAAAVARAGSSSPTVMARTSIDTTAAKSARTGREVIIGQVSRTLLFAAIRSSARRRRSAPGGRRDRSWAAGCGRSARRRRPCRRGR